MSLHKQGYSLAELQGLMHMEHAIIRHAFEAEIKIIDLADPIEQVSVRMYVYYFILLPECQL